jgi:signal transduction histidine kinase
VEERERRSPVTPELGQIASSWPLMATLAAAVSARGLLAGRRRTALNEALHELRRPLQALALAAPAARPGEATGLDCSVQMAAAALERLDREINGAAIAAVREPLEVGPLLEAAVARWGRSAESAGGSLRLCGAAKPARIRGDRGEILQTLDNLIANAIEHGGPRIVISAGVTADALRLAVADSGGDPRQAPRRRGLAAAIGRLTGRRRHGHGLRVVRRIAATHGGSFRLRRSAAGTEAVLDLPLVDGGPG